MRILLTGVQMFVFVIIMHNITAQGKLEIIIVPTAQPFNYKSPTSLIYSALRTYTQRMIAEKLYSRERNMMGHVIVRAQCFDGEKDVDFWSGFTGLQKKAIHLAKEGAGLSVLLYNYKDGYIQSNEFLHKYLNDVLKQPRIKPLFVRILVKQEQCMLIKQHYDDFMKKDTFTYRFITNPIDAGGINCAFYAVSYAQRAGVFPSFFEKQWKREIKISTKLLGPTDQIDVFDNMDLEPISWFRLMNFLRPVKWNSEGDKEVNIVFFDPQLMVEFIRKSVACLEDPVQCDDRPDITDWLKENKAKVATNEYMKGVEITLD
jgi:hypothetical protein